MDNFLADYLESMPIGNKNRQFYHSAIFQSAKTNRQTYQKAILQIGNLTIWQNDHKATWPFGNVTKWQLNHTATQQNRKLTIRQFLEYSCYIEKYDRCESGRSKGSIVDGIW